MRTARSTSTSGSLPGWGHTRAIPCGVRSVHRNQYVPRHFERQPIMNITLAGTVALVGAGEYLPAIAPVDTMLLERVAAHHMSWCCQQRQHQMGRVLLNA